MVKFGLNCQCSNPVFEFYQQPWVKHENNATMWTLTYRRIQFRKNILCYAGFLTLDRLARRWVIAKLAFYTAMCFRYVFLTRMSTRCGIYTAHCRPSTSWSHLPGDSTSIVFLFYTSITTFVTTELSRHSLVITRVGARAFRLLICCLSKPACSPMRQLRGPANDGLAWPGLTWPLLCNTRCVAGVHVTCARVNIWPTFLLCFFGTYDVKKHLK